MLYNSSAAVHVRSPVNHPMSQPRVMDMETKIGSLFMRFRFPVFVSPSAIVARPFKSILSSIFLRSSPRTLIIAYHIIRKLETNMERMIFRNGLSETCSFPSRREKKLRATDEGRRKQEGWKNKKLLEKLIDWSVISCFHLLTGDLWGSFAMFVHDYLAYQIPHVDPR